MTNETVSADTILTKYPPHAVRSILRRAGEECRQRGLYNSAKWTSELLISIPPSPTPSSSPPSSTSQYLTYPEDSVPTDISEINQDIYTFARDLFQQNEFLRCAYYLNEKCRDDGDHDATNVESGSGSGRRGWNKILFLKYYSRLLVCFVFHV
ncbi:hypothetical protein BKA69DRAFT_1103119 [Paraphysoderma sedebokerense]|nr:hypothetical protein BKA69DRAFT_1103119 [Paraphysoderma sedebokerense]